MNREAIAGIDLGTSSLKLLICRDDGENECVRVPYEGNGTKKWRDALKKAFSSIKDISIRAIGMSSQVGTYVINGTDIIEWNSAAGGEELLSVKEKYDSKCFETEISMPHPNIASYPIPRLMYIKKHYSGIGTVCQPKDLMCGWLTGNYVTDKYSWRGLANLSKNEFSDFFLGQTGIDASVLPKIIPHDEICGYVTQKAESEFGIKQGTPVFTGMNDFFSALIGMGIISGGDLFDVTGTSEHIGYITDRQIKNEGLVSGAYIAHNVCYGVTSSGGAALNYGASLYRAEDIDINKLCNAAPVFLPYLCGSRLPVRDSDIRGAFINISDKCTPEHMAYSVFEGIVFNLFEIYGLLDADSTRDMRVGGGAGGIRLLNRLKASLFNTNVITLAENEASALGAVINAVKGMEKNMTYPQIVKRYVKKKQIFEPDSEIRAELLKRYNIYKQIYPAIKKIKQQ